MKQQSFGIIIILIFAAVFLNTLSLAVAPSEEVIARLKETGKLESYMEKLRRLKASGADSPDKMFFENRISLGTQAIDTHHVAVILVGFADMPGTAGYAAPTTNDFDSLLFSDGYLNPTGSMKEYYYENSYGQYVIEGDVYGWYTSALDHDMIGPDGFSAGDLISSIVAGADPDIDFSKYDNNNDGYVDGLIVVHAGTGAEESGDATDIHSHQFSLQYPVDVDGVAVKNYTIQPEESFMTKSMISIGVFCHEWGHILGLPDLYDTDPNADNEGVGRWSVMASGNYNNLSRSPAHFDAWCKKALGWITPTRLLENTIDVEIPAVEYNPVVYQLRKNGSLGGEYFLIENRQKMGFDAGLPGAGLLIYHIDESRQTNNSDWHPKVFVEQADGNYNLQYGHNRGDAGDPWPRSGKESFHDKTDPGSMYYVGSSSQTAVWDITPSDSIMFADLEVVFSRPWLTLLTLAFSDVAFGNGNHIIEGGERIQVIMMLQNDWALIEDVQAVMTVDDPNLDILINTTDFDPIVSGSSQVGSAPFEFMVPVSFTPRIDTFFFDITANMGSFSKQYIAEINIGKPQIFIVDDDNEHSKNPEQKLYYPIYKTRTPVDVWNTNILGTPDANRLSSYQVVLWLTGEYRDSLLSTAEITALKGFLDNGGNLFLNGQGLASQLAVQDPDFLNNYLKADYIDKTTQFRPMLNPTEGYISETLRWMILEQTAIFQTVYDHILPINGGMAEWSFLDIDGEYAGVSYSGDYKSVFFAFGFEAIRDSDSARFEPSYVILDKIFEFFGDLQTSTDNQNDMAVNLPERFKLYQNYPNPFNPITTISYVVTGTGARIDRTRIDIYNLLGQHIINLVDRNEIPGEYQVTWDGRDGRGDFAASGVYFYRVIRGEQSQSRKMILLK